MELLSKFFSGFLVSVLVMSVFVGMPFSSTAETQNTELVLIIDVEGTAEMYDLQESGEIIDAYGRYVLLETSENRLRSLDERYRIDTLDDKNELQVKGHGFDMDEGIPEFSEELTIDGYEAGTRGLYIVDMMGPVNPEWREKLEDLDMELINYVPNYAYEVSMTPEQAEEVEDLFFVDQVDIYQPGFKLGEDVSPGSISVTFSDGERTIMEVENEDTLIELANRNDVYYISNHIEPKLHDEMATQIIGGGLWVWDPEDDPDSAYRGEGDYGSLANQLGYDGEGIVTAVADTGLGDGTEGDAGHPDFGDRVIGGYSYSDDGSWADAHGHGTHCTGSVAGHTHGGTGELVYENYYAGQGSAPATELFGVKVFDDGGGWIGGEDYHEIAEIPKQEEDAYVHSNSWGADTGGEYTDGDQEFDAAVRDANRDSANNEPMVITVAVGNSGPGENTVGSPSLGKNVIGVGSVDNYDGRGGIPDDVAASSSRGWTDDNRVKPDLMAPGNNVESTMPGGGYSQMSGTSMANPAAAGAATVVVDWYEEHHGERPSPAAVKAMLINTAYQLDEVEGNTGTIPNRDEGWGLVNLPALIDPPVEFDINDQTSLLETGDTDEYEIEYQKEGEPLKITLAYTDKEASVGDDPTLKNDLNLEVESPDGRRYIGNAFENGWTPADTDAMDDFNTDDDEFDDVNNVQNVYIHPDDLETGTYTVKVHGEDIPEDANNDGDPNQDYALVMQNTAEATGPSIEVTTPAGGETWNYEDAETIRWTLEEGDAPIDSVELEYSTDDGESWTEIETGLSGENYDWTVPDEWTDEARIRATVYDDASLSSSDISAQFSIRGTEPPAIEITRPTGGELWTPEEIEEISWDSSEGEAPIDNVDLEYSTDDESSWNVIDTGLDGSSYDWTVPDDPSQQARIRATVHDVDGYSGEDVSEPFTIEGELEEYDLTIDVEGQGDTDPPEGIHTYEEGEEITLTATPEEGWYFDEWTGDHTGTADQITMIMNEDKHITANFEEGLAYTLTINIEGEGTTDPEEGSHFYEEGEVVAVGATPAEGWEFIEWTDDETSTEPTIEVTMNEDKSITAIFERAGYQLTIETEEGGTTDPEPGTYSHEEGIEVTVEAIPDEDHEFVEWTGDAEGNEEEITITMDDDMEITANFEEQIEYDLTIDTEEGGTTDPVPGTYSHEEGTEVTVEAVPDDGHGFVEWTGDERGADPIIEITMDDDKSITAIFEAEEYDLDINVDGEGSVDIDPDKAGYEYGETVDLIASPADGWEFDQWTGDVTGSDSTIRVTMDDDKSVTAVFEVVEYELIIDVEGEGTVDPSEGTHVYEHGTQVTIEADPAEGYYFEEWRGDETSIAEELTVEMDDDMQITGVFEIIEYDLTIDIEGEGSTDLEEGTHTYEHGEEVTIEAIEEIESHYFSEWTGDHESEDEKITIEMEEDIEITAVFEIHEYDLTIDIEGEGSTEPAEGTHTYEYGEEVTVTATPDQGWEFDEWTGDITSTDDATTIEMDEDKEVEVEFIEEAFFEVEIISYDEEATEGEEFTVEFKVTNTGGSQDTQDVELYLAGELIETDSISLGPGEDYEGEFNLEGEEVGDHEVEVRSTDHSDSGVMTIEEEEDFLSNYWWLILVLLIGIIIAVVLIVVMSGEDEEEKEPVPQDADYPSPQWEGAGETTEEKGWTEEKQNEPPKPPNQE